jgi:F-type H+-transporting ATPase subunit gamma
MKMVAASRLRRAQERITQTRPYAYHLRGLVSRLAKLASSNEHPLLRAGRGGKVLLIVITSDRGLCGAFNSNIVNRALQAQREDFSGRDLEMVAVGRKGNDLLKRRDAVLRRAFTNLADYNEVRLADEITNGFVEDFLDDGFDAVYCIYNEFKSAVQQAVRLEQLLPLSHSEQEDESDGDERLLDYLYEPSHEVVYDALLVKNLRQQMHRILCESAASEYGARMTAMDAATNNAGEVINRLTLQYNRARQDAITTELIEVISGAEAL